MPRVDLAGVWRMPLDVRLPVLSRSLHSLLLRAPREHPVGLNLAGESMGRRGLTEGSEWYLHSVATDP